MMFVDDYSIVDTSYIIHAFPINPCSEHPDDQDYHIGLLLGVGTKGVRSSMTYPTRQRRDAAFEQLCAMVRAEQMEAEEA